MTRDVVVADAGPLIGLAVSGHLDALGAAFTRVLVPPAVAAELQLDASRPGSTALSYAARDGWLLTVELPEGSDVAVLTQILDPGEAEAIVLAQSLSKRLLIDDRRGRAVARRRGLTIIGTGGVLLLAKREGVVDRIAPILDALSSHGYRLSRGLRKELLRLSGEG